MIHKRYYSAGCVVFNTRGADNDENKWEQRVMMQISVKLSESEFE